MAKAGRPAKKVKKSFYKICSICGKELSLEHYYKDGTSKDGPRYRNECKECYRLRRQKREDERTHEVFPIKHVEEIPNENIVK
jgi:hypothetical protein